MGKLNSWNRACGVFILCAATAVAVPAQTFTVLHSFDGTDGAGPTTVLVQATNGDLYGTTEYGGVNSACGSGIGCGAVFKITPSGALTTLYSFCSQSRCADGQQPVGLVQATDGNFYGTTYQGGTDEAGTIFKITPGGLLTTLYNFCFLDGCADGDDLNGGLVQAGNGNFYGTTIYGGANGRGTVFEITPSGTLTTLYSFCSQNACADGSEPYAALVQGTDGNFYGTTAFGGANSCSGEPGCGTVFKITPSGTLTTLHSFDGADGEYPVAALAQNANGDFYGTTWFGGTGGECATGCGTVFKISSTGNLTTLYNFDYAAGGYPYAGLVQGSDGDFYGTTIEGGRYSAGVIFRVTSRGTLMDVHSFCSQSGCTDGNQSYAGLVQDTDGKFYGTTYSGGANTTDCSGVGCGTVFSLSVSLGPFVAAEPTSGPVGRPVKILGTNLTGATSVTFNGTAATFSVVSRSLIGTTVPVGATTGTVRVVTPSGTLSSNVPFRVVQ